jgi:hypothetical protein
MRTLRSPRHRGRLTLEKPDLGQLQIDGTGKGISLI